MSDNTKKEPLRLEFEEQDEFKGATSTDFITSARLAKIINNIFYPVFKDYNGCVIEPNFYNPQGVPNPDDSNVRLTLDFIPGYNNNEGGHYSAFVPVGTKSSEANSGLGKVAAAALNFNARVKTSETYEISEEAIEILYDYMSVSRMKFLKPNVLSFMNNRIISELVEGISSFGYPQNNVIHEQVNGLDINKLIRSIMPNKDDKGDKFYYYIQIIRALDITGNNAIQGPPTNYLYSITQLSNDKVSELAAMVGISDSHSNIITGR